QHGGPAPRQGPGPPRRRSADPHPLRGRAVAPPRDPVRPRGARPHGPLPPRRLPPPRRAREVGEGAGGLWRGSAIPAAARVTAPAGREIPGPARLLAVYAAFLALVCLYTMPLV